MNITSTLFVSIIITLTYSTCLAGEPQDTIQKEQVIILDAGHGGKDPGAQTAGLSEKETTLQLTKLIEKNLSEKKYPVILTCQHDQTMSLCKRALLANKTKNSSVVVSIHLNAGKRQNAEGIRLFICSQRSEKKRKASEKLATIISKQVESLSGKKSIIVHKNFYILCKTKAPAVLIEAGFITNPTDDTKLKNLEYRQQFATRVASGISEYLEQK